MENPLGQHLRSMSGPLLLTGHTGFKGVWMTFLLEHLNVPVVGYSLPPEDNSLFHRAGRTGAIQEKFADIRDYKQVEEFIDDHRPSTIIHMAAQPLVLTSYESPRETFDVNVMGTVNLLDIAFKRDFIKAIIVVTTDKVYKNDDSGVAYVESDPLEGKDPYSASKVGTEMVVVGWQQIEKVSGGPKIVSVRAGNVIGGGDFAKDRIVPDLVRGMLSRETVMIRNPNSTRPWQHVLDPLFGYLTAIESVICGNQITSLNFGPNEENWTVERLVNKAQEYLYSKGISLDVKKVLGSMNEMEAPTLNIDSTAAKELLNWRAVWSQDKAILKTFEWWYKFGIESAAVEQIIRDDVSSYLRDQEDFN
jgi:CDP-glucose 4,6-dehydratase